MTIKVTYNVTDVYVTQDVSPVYINVSYSGGGGSGAAVWGGITGTLSNQTDLQSALDAKVPYTGATGNIDLGEYELKAGQVEFDQTPTGTAGVGVMRWNDSDGTVDLGLKGGNVTLQIGQESVVRVVNKTGANLLESQYKVCRVRTSAEGGAQGQRLAVVLAQANTKANHSGVLGIVTENINNNQEGFITTFGSVRDINTTGSLQGETWADGDSIWLSESVAGGLTNVEPTTHPVKMGYVLYAHSSNGKIFVSLEEGVDELNELHDVTLTSATSGQVLKYNGSIWVNDTISGALGYTPANAATTLTINGVTYDLSANRSWTVGGGISGSGASGQVAYWTGTSAQSGDDGLTWDITNKRLTINTSGQGGTISTYRPTGSAGFNIWIGGGGNSSTYTSGNTASYNTSVGVDALRLNTTGLQNSAFGNSALYTNNIGNYNSAFGANALLSNTTGIQNNAFGYNTLYSNTTGSSNMGFGINALRSTTTGGQNVGIGAGAGYGTGTNANTTGSNNIFIGYQSVGVSSTESNRTWIGNSSTTSTWLGGNLLLGSTSNSGERLQVTGNVKVVGVAGNNFSVINSSAQNNFTIADNGSFNLGGTTTTTRANISTQAFSCNLNVTTLNIGNWDGTVYAKFSGLDGPSSTFMFGGTSINASAKFEIASTNKGFLPPRMTTTQKNAISSPAAGLVVYDTTLAKLCVYTTAWETITSV